MIHNQTIANGINALVLTAHGAAKQGGWWTNLETGEPLQRNKGELLMLAVSELAEAMEGCRKNLMDDKIVSRPMVEVEIADCIIRLADFAGGFDLDIAGAIIEKMQFNAQREDHRIENRQQVNGKKF